VSSGQDDDRDPVIEAYRAGIDETLIRENLRLTYDERILKLMDLQRLAEELRRCGKAPAADPPVAPTAALATRCAFLPGAGGRAGFWRPVAERLPAPEGSVLLGWPGFGDAPADPRIASLDDLAAWALSRLPPGRCDLVAQSMGGVVALLVALAAPERVRRLVLAATSGGLDVAALGASDWRAEYLAHLPGVPRWFVEDRTDLSARLGEVRAPVLLLWSDSDPVSPLAVGEALRQRLPDARLEVVRGGSHGFAEERADEVAELVRAFLAA
jgi:pimeloyl-ACP methyl ester carboxylesterase